MLILERAAKTSPVAGATGLLVLLLMAPGCGTSDPTNSPVPALYSVEPDTLPFGGAEETITLTGKDFAPTARARWNGTDLPTTVSSSTVLRARVGQLLLAQAGSAEVSVVNPAPGGGTSGTVSAFVGYAVPVLESLSPSRVTAWGPSFTLSVRGGGFASGSEVYLNNSVRPEITSTSPTELRVVIPGELIWEGTVIQVLVYNPQPGGGTSRTLDLTAEYPIPAIISLNPDTASTDTDTLWVTATGAGFFPRTELRFNGSPLVPVFPSATQIRFRLTRPQLQTAGSLPVVAINPPPRGGTSNSVPFNVRLGRPRITSLSPSAGTVGSGPLTVTLSGANFAPNSRVTWNGFDRSTSVVNTDTITFTLTAFDQSQIRTGSIVVVGTNGTSTPVLFPVLPGLASPQEITVPQRLVHIVYDSVRRVLWGSAPADAPTRANSLLAIDPSTGAITQTIALPGDPGRVAISAAGRYLYAALRATPTVVRVDLTSGVKDLEFPVGIAQGGTSLFADDLEVPADAPQTVVVARRGGPADATGVAVFDNGVARTLNTDLTQWANRLTRGPTSTRFYAFLNNNSLFPLIRLKVSSAGIEVDGVEYGLIQSFFADIEYDGGFLYSSAGDQIDPERLERLGSFGVSGPVCPDVAAGRVYYHSNGEIRVFHYLTRVLLGRFAVANGAASAALVRWGGDGLALVTADALVIVRSSLIGS